MIKKEKIMTHTIIYFLFLLLRKCKLSLKNNQNFIKKFQKIFMKYSLYNLWIIILQKSKSFFLSFWRNKKKRLLFQSSFQFHNLIKLEEIRKKLERKIYYNVIFCLLIYLYIQINIKFLSYLKYISFLTHTKKNIESKKSNIFCITYFIPNSDNIPNRYITYIKYIL